MASKVYAGRCDAAQALVAKLVFIIINKYLYLGFEINGQEVVFQQDVILQGLKPLLNFALSLEAIRRTVEVLLTFVQ